MSFYYVQSRCAVLQAAPYKISFCDCDCDDVGN